MADPLTKIQLDRLKPGKARREIADGGAHGLYFIVQPSGARSWALRYRVDGRSRKHTIGSYPEVDLAAARRLARKAHGELAQDKDPAAIKKAAKVAAKAQAAEVVYTVAHVAELFVEKYAKPRNRSWEETARLLDKEVVSKWGKRSLASITRAELHDLLDKIVDRPAPIIANRVLAAFRRLCNWSVERGIITASPCANIKAPAPERTRDRTLSDDEIRAVWAAFDGEGYPFGDVGKLLLLTAARRDEVTGMSWGEVDLEAKTWTIARERCKNGIEHVVPLSDAALDVLTALPRIEASKGAPGYVFSTTGKTAVSGLSKFKARVDSVMTAGDGAASESWVLHDIRRTAASGMVGLGIAPHIVEAVLNHKSGTIKGVAAVYNRYSYATEKRDALDRWAAHVDRIVEMRARAEL
jgi:integrase